MPSHKIIFSQEAKREKEEEKRETNINKIISHSPPKGHLEPYLLFFFFLSQMKLFSPGMSLLAHLNWLFELIQSSQP